MDCAQRQTQPWRSSTGGRVFGFLGQEDPWQKSRQSELHFYIGAFTWDLDWNEFDREKGHLACCRMQLKHLFLLIDKYAKRVLSQAERQQIHYQHEEHAITIEVASNVTTIEALPICRSLPSNLRRIRQDIMNKNMYELVDVSSYMGGMSKWQR